MIDENGCKGKYSGEGVFLPHGGCCSIQEQKTGMKANEWWKGRGGEWICLMKKKITTPYPKQRKTRGKGVWFWIPLDEAVPAFGQGGRGWRSCFSRTCSRSMSREGDRGGKQSCARYFKHVKAEAWAKGNWEPLNGAECWGGGIAEGRVQPAPTCSCSWGLYVLFLFSLLGKTSWVLNKGLYCSRALRLQEVPHWVSAEWLHHGVKKCPTQTEVFGTCAPSTSWWRIQNAGSWQTSGHEGAVVSQAASDPANGNSTRTCHDLVSEK